MQTHRHPVQLARAHLARRPLLLLWLVAVLLLKASAPLIAATAAHQRGVPLAEVCSVYGVRTVAVDEDHQSAPEPQAEHAGEHCSLTPLLGAVLLDGESLAVDMRPASTAVRTIHPRPFALPVDRHLAWLAGRTHAPPVAA
jgi:hypothetical protein